MVRSLARWDGSSWASLGGGLETNFTSLAQPSGIQALAVFDDGSGPALFATGSTTAASDSQFHGIAKWDGVTWLPLGAGLTSPGTGGMAMVPFEGRLVVGGGFSAASGLPARGVAKWGSAGWSVFGSNLTGQVSALALFDDGTGPALYAGGTFLATGGRPLNRIARWSGNAWESVGAGFNGDVRALAVFNDGGVPALFAGGAFTLSGSTAVSGLAKWNGLAWSNVSGGVMNGAAAGVVEALAAFSDNSGPALFAGGTFTLAGGVSANRVARWSGTGWSALGSGLNNSVYALTTANVGGTSALFAGGSFTTAGGATANRIARWNGTAWSALGTGTNNIVMALQAWPPNTGTQLLAGGTFTTAGGVSASKLARWSGTAWSAITGGSPNNTIETLLGRQEGSTNRIVAGGAFTQVGTKVAGRIADWNGTAWTALGTGASSGSVFTLLEQDEPDGRTLWLGGSFTTVGGISTPAIAKWNRPLTCGDTSGPVMTITSPAAGALLTTSQPALTVTHTDTLSGVDVATLQWKVNGLAVATTCTPGSGQSSCTLNAPLSQGTALLQATALDLVGNLGASPAISVTVDTAPPVVTVTSPANGAILTASPATIAVSYSDATSAIVPGSFLMGGTGPAAAQWSCPLNETLANCHPTAPLIDGSWTLLPSIADATGLRGETSVAFIVDTVAPVIALVQPSPGFISYGGQPQIRISVTDAGSGAAPLTTSLRVDGVVVASTCSGSLTEVTCGLLAPAAPGTRTISATLMDRAGRLSNLASVQIEVRPPDTQAPAISITSPIPFATQNPTVVPFELAWSDADSGIAPATLRLLANGTQLAVTCTTSSTSASCLAQSPLTGIILLVATVEDGVGNLGASASVTFVADADLQAPEIVVLS
ncbi:MAG: hypothetical protein ABIV06_13040, partial [Thermoanaerobaculia bacterium]